MASHEANKETARLFVRQVCAGRVDPVLMTDDFVHWTAITGELDCDKLNAVMGRVVSLFTSPFVIEVDGIIAEGNRVALEAHSKRISAQATSTATAITSCSNSPTTAALPPFLPSTLGHTGGPCRPRRFLHHATGLSRRNEIKADQSEVFSTDLALRRTNCFTTTHLRSHLPHALNDVPDVRCVWYSVSSSLVVSRAPSSWDGSETGSTRPRPRDPRLGGSDSVESQMRQSAARDRALWARPAAPLLLEDCRIDSTAFACSSKTRDHASSSTTLGVSVLHAMRFAMTYRLSMTLLSRRSM